MRRLVVAGVLLAAAASCAPEPPRQPVRLPPPPRHATATPYVTPKPSSLPAPSPAAATRDACGAAAHAYLVGKARTEIPIPVNPAQRRVACTTCPITEDHVPTRLNIFYDEKTNLITEVRCG